jgi:alpha-methylacyl-CoA racemase
MSKTIRILDLSHRLPGPLAAGILADQGYEVTKLEDEKHRDPFLSGMFSAFDNSFEGWYRELNKKKKILRLDFKAVDIKQQVHKLLLETDILLLSLSSKLKETLGVDDVSLKALNRPLAVVELKASESHKNAMHDLNALAISGFLSLHVAHQDSPIVAPPFLPVAGIVFGQQVATQALANLLQAREQNTLIKSVSYLFESTQNILAPFWPKEMQQQKRTKFLHNGAYPCYSLYRLKDGHYAALAAVEDQFWSDLLDLFKIPLPLEQRFNTDPASFEKVASVFANLTANEIEVMISNKELCLSIVRKV